MSRQPFCPAHPSLLPHSLSASFPHYSSHVDTPQTLVSILNFPLFSQTSPKHMVLKPSVSKPDLFCSEPVLQVFTVCSDNCDCIPEKTSPLPAFLLQDHSHQCCSFPLRPEHPNTNIKPSSAPASPLMVKRYSHDAADMVTMCVLMLWGPISPSASKSLRAPVLKVRRREYLARDDLSIPKIIVLG